MSKDFCGIKYYYSVRNELKLLIISPKLTWDFVPNLPLDALHFETGKSLLNSYYHPDIIEVLPLDQISRTEFY